MYFYLNNLLLLDPEMSSRNSSIEDLIERFQASEKLQTVEPKEIKITQSMFENDDIPSIPDIDEIQGSTEIPPPLLDPVKVSTYDELSKGLQRNSTISLQDIDLSPLMSCLKPDNSNESDIFWTIDSLLSELIQNTTYEQ